jgi:hypothetical protein
MFEGVDPVTNVTFVLTGGFVTPVIVTTKVDAGLVQEPITA